MARPTTARPPDWRGAANGHRTHITLAALFGATLLLGLPAGVDNARAQTQFQTAPGSQPAFQNSPGGSGTTAGMLAARRDPDAQMLVRAEEVQYDYTNERVSAVGKVQIYYSGSTLEADRVIYDQKTKRLRAEGNVRLRQADGNVIYGEILDLTDDFRDGFVDSLRLDAADRTRFAAARADRGANSITVFQSGVYTACEPCKDNPQAPPFWQVKAARIIHDENEKMIYFEDARLEFFGVPMAYLPFFSAPDPTVKRKTGFLIPKISSSSKYGYGIEIPYFWALAPDYDLTLSPMITTKQGVLMTGEWRQRLINGAYSVRASGIFQTDKDYFLRDAGHPATPGYRDWRGSIETKGLFSLNERWVWGWDATLLSDKTFFQDYPIRSYQPSEVISQAFIAGRGARSYFDARVMHFYGLSEFDVQSELPVIHPVIDYSYVFGPPVFGGELSTRINFTSLSRGEADFDPISQSAFNSGQCTLSADPAQKLPKDCVLRGVPGSYTRFSGEMEWKRSLVDSLGQVFTPFVRLRADVAAVSINSDVGVDNFIQTGTDGVFRGMPAVGLEYRYPFLSAHSWGTQTLEPIAQVIVRPNETHIGDLPNEDAQSLVFDDSNLFAIDKFSGWDRVEGGTRANVGIQYTAQVNGAGFFSALFGQSYQLFGQNSFAQADTVNTGLESGLDQRVSDYVARLSFQPNRTYKLSSRFRFDEETFEVRRLEVEGSVNFDRWSASVLYGNYDAQPLLGFLERREGILGSGAVKLTSNWTLRGSARYDLDAGQVDQTMVGLGYIDDCFAIAVSYITDHSYSGNTEPDRRVMLQIDLRTLGGTAFSTRVGGADSSTTHSSIFR